MNLVKNQSWMKNKKKVRANEPFIGKEDGNNELVNLDDIFVCPSIYYKGVNVGFYTREKTKFSFNRK